MKIVVLKEWNKLSVEDVPIPELSEGECLIKVVRAGICGSDLHIYDGHHPTAKTPVILGHEFIGTIEKINDSNSEFEKGDRVGVEPLISCGECEACKKGLSHVCKNLHLLGIHRNGAFAEYVKVFVDKMVKIPSELNDDIATLSEPFAVGVHVNERAGTAKGDDVFIIGAGPIGLIVGIVASLEGAKNVVFSEIQSDKIDLVESLGFSVINPKIEDIDKKIANITNGNGFDKVFEASGSEAGILLSTSACKVRGTIVPVGFPSEKTTFDILQVIFKEISVIGSRVYTFDNFKKAVSLLSYIENKKIFPLENMISDTLSLDNLEDGLVRMKEGKALGRILVTN
ncbi:zinc-dependent alcohol dehydrogenase [Gracilibacillus kekensis]|uniref:Threonine dehydrogenase n=1 Tax=Gracilibacillus kekensis TaxID=1027249 RepID=A0A1M7QT14_9BACI|nr:alcohol dehydrogenase catalytic domain-containing protein [Gracilibacillus kekensis]SHN34860.1 Threonine dehydrogenase [Gracilibacillus kekensis]